MITNYSQISSNYALSRAKLDTKTADSSSSSDIMSSFKEILSTMTAMTNSTASTGEQSGFGATDLMAPLMLILLEKLMEQQLDTSAITTDATQASTARATSTKRLARTEPSGRPVGGVLTQDFHPGHNGLDFGVVVGTPIKSTMDGKVTYAGWNTQGYGNLVIVDNGTYQTYYAHLSSIPVAVGDAVTANSTIGLSGNTGHSTGPHLHYEIRKNNVPIDPTAVTLGTTA